MFYVACQHARYPHLLLRPVEATESVEMVRGTVFLEKHTHHPACNYVFLDLTEQGSPLCISKGQLGPRMMQGFQLKHAQGPEEQAADNRLCVPLVSPLVLLRFVSSDSIRTVAAFRNKRHSENGARQI